MTPASASDLMPSVPAPRGLPPPPPPPNELLTNEEWQRHGTILPTSVGYLDSVRKDKGISYVLKYINTLQFKTLIDRPYAQHLSAKMKSKDRNTKKENVVCNHWLLRLMDMTPEERKKDKEEAIHKSRKRYEREDRDIDRLEQEFNNLKRIRTERVRSLNRALTVYDLLERLETTTTNTNTNTNTNTTATPTTAPLSNQ
jgi:hypothetical protein